MPEGARTDESNLSHHSRTTARISKTKQRVRLFLCIQRDSIPVKGGNWLISAVAPTNDESRLRKCYRYVKIPMKMTVIPDP
jgi:hypothetical protein